MNILLNSQIQQPVYLQICEHIKRLIKTGVIQAGERLPSIRSMAGNLQINKSTVVEAYNSLEANGLVYARQGAGYFVNGSAISFPEKNSFPELELENFDSVQAPLFLEQQEASFFKNDTTGIQARKQEGIIDFSSGFPHFSELKDLQKIARRAMLRLDDMLSSYAYPQGQLNLRKQIARMLLQQGLEVSSENLIITSGSQQGLYLAMCHCLQPGDKVALESPAYPGVIKILKSLRARIIEIPVDADGMDLEVLERCLRNHCPKLIYTNSTLHNPTGLTTSLAHRQQLLSLAKHYQCRIVENNAYAGLNFEYVPPPIKVLDRDNLVIYIGTFSKTIRPGLRMGYMVVPKDYYQSILEDKLLFEQYTPILYQEIISEYLAIGHYRRHLNRIRVSHLEKRNFMLQALERYFPQEISWTVPIGGIFLSAKLLDGLPIQDICREALSQKVLISCGKEFFPRKHGYPLMRLNFSHSFEVIDRGISVLGRLLKEYLST